MTKYLKYILYTLMIISLLFTIKIKVNALSYDYTLGSQIRFIEQEKKINFEISNPNNSNNWKNYIVNFDYNIENQNAKFVRFTYAGQIENIGNFTQNIVWNETCTERVDPSANFSIRFADNSTATISRTAYQTLCDLHKINGNITESTFDINDFNFRIYLRSANGNWPPCEIDNGFILCPIENNKTYTGLVFRYYGNESNMSFITYKMLLTDLIWTINTDAQNIINNQNQNTNTINNNITNLNDSITSSDVEGNTSNDTITNIGSTFDTENDFLLNLLTIPYTFWTSLTNVFSNSCSALNVGTIFDTPLIFPCIELNNYLGDVFTTIIDVIFSGICMSAFVRRIIKYYQALLSLDNNASAIGGVKIW